MAVDPNANKEPVTVPQTVPDNVRYGVGLVLIGLGLFFFALSVIILSFPVLGGSAAPGLQYGPLLVMSGIGVIWDRQTPVFKVS